MPDIKDTRRRFLLLVIVLACLSVAAAALLISPIGRGARLADQRITDLQRVLGAKTREVAPLTGIDQKVDTAKQQIDSFYRDRLPGSYSSISEELGRIAAANNVQFSTGHYKSDNSDTPDGLTRVQVEATIAGDYLQIVKFINSLERDKTFFLINSVSVGQSQAGTVQLQIQLETYLRTA
jgi:type IV pilus assembly protein PilO